MLDYFVQNPVAPEFAAIRSRLALAFVQHKAAIGAANVRDEDIVENVDNISAALMVTFLTACIDEQRDAFVAPFGWFVETIAEVLDEVPCRRDS